MREILEALKNSILNWLERPDCERCAVLEAELDYERSQKEKLQRIIFINARLTNEEVEDIDTEMKSISRHVSLRDAIKRKQEKINKERSKEKVEPAKNKTEAEEIFEKSLQSIS